MKAEAKKRLTKFVNSLFSVVLVVGLLPTWALSNPQQAYAAAADYTVTATVDGLDDDTLPVLVGGTDFTPGQPVNADPVYYTDADGNTPLADLAAQKAKQGLSLKWTDAETGKDFSWTETPINKSYEVEGSWVQTQCTVTVNANDGGKTAKQEVTVPWGKSYASVKGGAPATPTYSGWQFLGWYTQDGKQYDFNSKVTESLVVEAKWAVADVTVVPTTNPDNDIDQNLSGTCWVGATWSWHPAQFALSNFSGKLAGVTATGYCADRSAAPASNVQATYSATLRSVNKETGEVVYDLYITPPDATNGKDRNQYGLIGYQHISAQITLIKNFGGWLEINKSSSNPAISDNNDCYDLEGAEYAVFNQSNQAVAKLTTDANGYAKSGLLPSGEYTVKELKAPKGYALDEEGHQVRITSGQTTTSNLADEPQNDPAEILLGKYDGETTYNPDENGNLPIGGAKLYGAQYSIEYYDGYYNTEADAQASGNPTRKWVMQTNQRGRIIFVNAEKTFDVTDSNGNVIATLPYKVSGDDFYKPDGIPTLPLGTVVIKEIKAPNGYNLPEPFGMPQTYVRQITADSTTEEVSSFNSPEQPEPVLRSDVEFTKAASDDSHSLAGVPFKITSKTTHESHVIVTDENGKASTKASWNKHTQDTNGNDWIMSEDAEGVQGFVAKLLDAAKVLNPTCGVWFGQYTENGETKITDPDDERGALPYDEYTLEELPCDVNAGYQLIKKDFTISRDNSFNADNTVNLGTLTDQDVSISTQAYDKADGDQEVVAEPDVTVVDKVSCDNLQKGTEYIINGTLMDKATGKPYVDAAGNEVHGSVTFTAKSQEQDAYVEFTFDGSNLTDSTELVVFETIATTENPDRILDNHEDINDLGQTVTVKPPVIGTIATDGIDNDKQVVKDTEMVVTDTVAYYGLTPGKQYTLKGELMDKATGTVLKDAAGNPVTAEKQFTPNATAGTVEIQFTFDGSNLKKDQNLVAFEHVLTKGKEIATHAEITDIPQTVTVIEPSIKTTAKSSQAGHENSDNVVRDTTATVKDTVEYKNLVPGKEYTLIGKMMDKATGAALLKADGTEATGKATFTPETANGNATVEITFDCADLDGHSLVAFEKLYRGETTIASHEDIDDVDQTVKVDTPLVETTATSSQAGHEGDHNVVRDTTATVVDTVHYEGLVIGKTYTVTGKLMDKSTGKAFVTAAGNEVTATKEFTPKAADGDVTLEFTLDTSDLEGKELVAFEKVSQDGKEIGVHEDITDDSQTIKVVPPTIKTTATSNQAGHEGDKNLVRDTEATLTDTVKYEGLVTGKTYTFTGKVIDKVTGKTLLNADGSEVTVSKTITADDTYGTVELEFTVNCASLDGHDLVVFEKVYQDSKEVGSHEDLNDGDQTVKVVSPELATTAIDGIDGDKNVVKDPEAEVTDTVEYKGLVTGKEYTVTGTIMDKATGNPYIDPSTGKEITGETTFTPDDTYGTVDVKFAFDASQLDENSQLVVFEKISRNGEEVGGHEDIDDEAQAVSIIVPEIHTNAADGLDGDKEVIADHKATVVDTVSYEKLVPGKTYVVSGTLMVKETGEALLDAEGNPVTASTEFVPEAPEGTVDVVFTFDSDLLAGKELVAFEKLYRNQIEITVHEDIDDEDQTTTVVPPQIGTTATDTADGDKHMAADPESSITDEIQYKNLVPGDEYMVAGILMDKSTGLPLLSGEGASAVSTEDLQKFTDELMAACGLDGGSDTVTVDDQAFGEGFEVTATDNGYEYTDELGVKHVLAKGDEGWKLTELEGTIETEVGTYTDDQVTVTKGEATLPLNPDYEAIAKVMQENPDIVSCLSIQKTTFTPEEQTGSVSMDFPINSIYNEDTETVVFEFLFKGSELIAHESDIDNEGQTVEIVTPKLSTTATDKTDGDHTLLPSREATVVDHVEYTDLIPGKEYTIEGVLMDKSTGTELIVGDGKVTAVATFVPNHADGSVDLEFTFDASELGGKDLVAFEVAYKDGIQIADHQDINDEGQTVSVSPVVDNGQDTPGDGYSKTGVDMTLVYALIAALVALAGGAGAYALRQRKLAAAEGKEEDGSDKE